MISPSSRKILFSLSVLIILWVAIPITPTLAVTQGTETRISYPPSSGCNNYWPSGDNGWIVWEEECGTAPSDQTRILAYNYSTAHQRVLPNATLHAHSPKMKGNRVVWYEESSGIFTDVYYTDLGAGSLTSHRLDLPPSEKTHPGVDGDYIVWQDCQNQGSICDILLYDISSSKLYNLSPDTDLSDQLYPSIAGGVVVWQDNRDGEQNIYYNDTSDWSHHFMPIDPFHAGGSYYHPVTDGNSVVWYEDSANDILLSDLSDPDTLGNPVVIDNSGNFKFSPSVCSTFVVWKDDAGSWGMNFPDLILYDRTTGTPETITNSANIDPDPDVSPTVLLPDSRILWVDIRNTNHDIYMITLGPTEICPFVQFSADKTEGSPPLGVQFTDTSLNSPTFWYWDFGDGQYSSDKSPIHEYSTNGNFKVRLTSATPNCRNTTLYDKATTISVGIPTVGLSANTTEGLAPLTVSFTGTGTNSPTSWAWSFDDVGSSTVQNPTYTYNEGGTYSVTLTATNAIGSGSKTRSNYITALKGIQIESQMTIPGITITGSGSGQHLDFDESAAIPYFLSSDHQTLVTHPDSSHGWSNITFISGDMSGFTESSGTAGGTISSIIFKTNESFARNFSATVGKNLPIHYAWSTDRWDNSKTVTTQLWENEAPSDDSDLSTIIHNSGYANKDIAYTMTLIRNGITTPASAQLNFSVSSSWVEGTGDITTERTKTFVIAEGYNSIGDKVGIILPATYVRSNNNIDFFVVDISSQYSYLNKFALAKLSGSGNPFQLITLTIASQANAPPPSGGSESYGNSEPGSPSGSSKDLSSQAPQIAAEQKAPVAFIDPGQMATLYANSVGVITQETTLISTDTLASVVLGEGTIAKDSAGSPLSSISIASLAPDAIPAAPPSGQAVMIDGRSYELGPDGATFSPGISVTFTIPQAQWGKEYSLMMYDRTIGTWSEIPGSFNAKDGTFTAVLSHFCCVALFEKNIGQPAIRKTTQTPQPEPARLAPVETPTPQPPQNALSIVFSMAEWISGDAVHRSSYLTALAIICIIVLSIMLLHRRRNNP
jgi:beta propeller repeat protein